MNAMTFRFVSLFAAAYSHGEAAAADALLYGIFGPFRYIFLQGGCGNIYFSVSVVLFLFLVSIGFYWCIDLVATAERVNYVW